MIVYIESNFVLELALQQEDSESCSNIMDMAERDLITLVIPAYCLVEPLIAWNRKSTNRRILQEQITTELSQIGRSKPYTGLVEELQRVTSELVRVTEEGSSRLNDALNEITSAAHVITIDSNVIESAGDIRRRLSLGPQDAVVYASVLAHLGTSTDIKRTKCFLNTDAKDFMIPEIEDELSSHNCRIIPSFGNGLDYIKTRIGG